MKRNISLLITLFFTIVMLSSCDNRFTFQKHHFGDSLEQVKKIQGSDGELDDTDGEAVLWYDEKECIKDVAGSLAFGFKDDKLVYIQIISRPDKSINEFSVMKRKLAQYGSPDQEMQNGNAHMALWKKDDYGMILIFSPQNVFIAVVSDPGKAAKAFETKSIMDLYE